MHAPIYPIFQFWSTNQKKPPQGIGTVLLQIVRNLVAVVLGFVGTFDRYADIIGLFVTKSG